MSAQKIDINEVFDKMTPIEDAFQKAFESVVHDHAWRGLPIIGWHDGKITYADPNSFYLDGTVPRPANCTIPSVAPIDPVVDQQNPVV
jgi:hypothetical protein